MNSSSSNNLKTAKAFLSLSKDSFAILDKDGVFEKIDADLFPDGSSLFESGESLFDLIHPEELSDVRSIVSKVGCGLGFASFTVRVRGKNRAYRWFNCNLASREEVPGYYLSFKDVHSKKIAEQSISGQFGKMANIFEDLQAIFENAPSGLIKLDLKLTVVACNRKFRLLLGFSSEEVISHELIRKKLPFGDSTVLNKVLTGELKELSKTNEIYINEKKKFISIKFLPIRDSANDIISILGIFDDVTEVKNLGRRLNEEKARLLNILQAAPATLYSMDPTKNFSLLYLSPNLIRFGHSPSDLTNAGEFWSSFVHPDDISILSAHHQKILKEGASTVEFRLLKSDGTYALVQDDGVLHRDSFGEMKEIVGFWKDITEEVKAKESFKAYYQALNSVALLSSTDENGIITSINENLSALTGYSEKELIGKDHRVLNSGFHGPEFFQAIWSTIKAGKSWVGDIRNKKKDGSYYWVRSVIAPIANAKAKIGGFFSIRFDISNFKDQEQRLIIGSKLASLGEMAGGVAHEINNPLAIIMSKASLTRRMVEGGKATNQILIDNMLKIESTGERISQIVRGLQFFARAGDAQAFEVVKIKQIVEDTVALCKEKFLAAGVDIRISKILDLNLECKPVQISQVLLNLLNNAFDAIKESPVKWIEISIEQKSQVIQIAVVDSGSGISAEISGKIMDPFFTTKPQGKGTGLGLSISKGIIDSHGGEIHLDQQKKNTTFVFSLPIQQQNPKSKAA